MTAVTESSTSITVTWDNVAPRDQNGVIIYFVVRFQPQETFGGSISTGSTLVSGARRSFTLSNLEEFVEYRISLRAYNFAGWGPFSNKISVLTLANGNNKEIFSQMLS